MMIIGMLLTMVMQGQPTAQLTPRKLEKVLTSSTKNVKRKVTAHGVITGATSGPTSIVLHFVPNDPNVAAEMVQNPVVIKMLHGGYCIEPYLGLMNQYGVSVQFSIEPIDRAPETITITSSTCSDYFNSTMFANNADTTPALVIPGREKLPMFDFKDVVAGQPVNISSFKNCRQLGPNVRCRPLSDTVAGIDPGFVTFEFYNSRLSKMDFDVHVSQAPTLIAAFTQKYGEPCKTEDQVWQSKLGAKFDNEAITWCFGSGNLILTLRGSRIDATTVVYFDLNKAPAAAIPIDF